MAGIRRAIVDLSFIVELVKIGDQRERIVSVVDGWPDDTRIKDIELESNYDGPGHPIIALILESDAWEGTEWRTLQSPIITVKFLEATS